MEDIMDIIEKNFLYTIVLIQTVVSGFLHLVTFKKISIINETFKNSISEFKNLRVARRKI